MECRVVVAAVGVGDFEELEGTAFRAGGGVVREDGGEEADEAGAAEGVEEMELAEAVSGKVFEESLGVSAGCAVEAVDEAAEDREGFEIGEIGSELSEEVVGEAEREEFKRQIGD